MLEKSSSNAEFSRIMAEIAMFQMFVDRSAYGRNTEMSRKKIKSSVNIPTA
jgi:hypothetical protein